MTKKRFSGRWYIITVILVLLIINSSGILHAAQLETAKYEFFSFNNIAAEKGLEYFNKAKLGDVSRLPGSSMLLVTSPNPVNLERAKVIRDIVDCSQDYEIRFIPWLTKELPGSKQIMNEIGTIAIGNFSNPPSKEGHARTIIDTFGENIIIIAPSKMVTKIVNAIDHLQKTNSYDNSEEIQVTKTNEATYKTATNSNKLNITPSLLAQNVSENEQDLENLNQRITDTFTSEENTAKTQPVAAKSNLSAENTLVDISSIPNPDSEIVINFPEQLTLTELIGLAGPYLKMDFMYNASELVGDVTINPNGVLKGSIKIRDLYDYLDTVLQFKGFAMVRGKNNLVTIVPKGSVQDINPNFAQKTITEAGDSVIIDTFELKNISTSAAKSLIDNMKLGIQITEMAENKKLMITEYASRMPRIRALLEIVDIPGDPKKFRFRQLKHTYPQTLVPKVQSLAEQLENLSVTITTTEAISLPERPTQRPGESATAFNNRLRTYDTQVRQREAAAARGATSSSTSPGQPINTTVFIDSDDRTNRVLMIGLDKQLDKVEELIDTLDVAQNDPREFRKYKIEYLDADEVLNKLHDLNVIPKTQDSSDSSQSRTNSPTRITSRGEAQEPVAVSSPRSSSNGDSDTLQAVGEEPLAVLVASTNSLLINATKEQHDRIAAVIELVDKAREETPYKIYQLKNSDPTHIKDILDQLVEDTIRDAEDKIDESEALKQDKEIYIVADPNTSSLIVNANMKNQNWIESLIKVLDKRRPQVLIDVTLVQIAKNDIFNYDLNLLSSIPDLTNTSGLTSAILPGVSSGAANLVQPLIDSGRSNFLDFQANSGAGTGFYGDKHINALLTMMEQKDYGRVMAKPQILVNDNQMGSISTTDRTYVIKETSTIIEGVSQPVQSGKEFEGYDAGITLEITPHISESDLLRLDIMLQRSDFGTITGDRPPDTTDSIVQTKVTIPDGSTIILGGMLKMNQSKGGSKIPLLSDIPLIGTLFKNANNSDIQRNLYVFVKAEIIRPPDEDGSGQVDLERISKQNKELFEEYEKQFQEYQSFPGIKPTPMEPAKVLEY